MIFKIKNKDWQIKYNEYVNILLTLSLLAVLVKLFGLDSFWNCTFGLMLINLLGILVITIADRVQ